MRDLISRQAAIEQFIALWECIDEIMDKEEWEDVCKTTANEISSASLYIPDKIQTMQDLEWAQLEKMYELGKEERKKGKWIKTYRDGFGRLVGCCNQCRVRRPVENFCPNCGADMRGDLS